MDRKKFIITCGFACAGSIGVTSLLQGCSVSKILNGKIAGDDLVIPVTDFENTKHSEGSFRKYIIVQHEMLQYPVCVYRFSANEYTALWMRCTHQGTELQVFGDRLQCPAHGSEFTNKGGIQSGPADTPLRRFPVIIENGQIKISLKAV